MSRITTLKGCRLRAVLFADMAKGGFLQVHQCVEHPRLMKRVTRQPGVTQIEVTWYVDGKEVATLEAAVAALNGEDLIGGNDA